MTKDWINIHWPLLRDFLETLLESNKEIVLGAIPRGYNCFGNYADDASGCIVFVWDPRIIMVIYDAIAQSAICGISILSENISLTVTFVYDFNLVEDRANLWTHLFDLEASSPVSSHPWSVLGDFNQMLHTSHQFNHLVSHVDVSGLDEANIGL